MLQIADISTEALANILDQSVDCVKLLNSDGHLLWMNSNGICAMEIDDVSNVYGSPWISLWPDEAQETLSNALLLAGTGRIGNFEAFCPTAKGTPRWWNVTVSKVTSPDGGDAGFLSISRDITDAELQKRALAIAAEEMRHRLKNTYAMVGGLLSGFARGNAEHELFAREMQVRLVALSAAQSLLAEPGAPSDTAELIPALVEAFATPACEISTQNVQRSLVSQGQGDALALIVGELAVNSAKHGALRHGGKIEVSTETLDGALQTSWIEVSNQPVAAKSRPGGQGINLIQRIVAIRNGTIETVWETNGPIVTVRFPIATDV